MKLGRRRGERPDRDDDPADETVTSEVGWIKVDVDLRLWIPLPFVFPDGYDLDSWAMAAAVAWAAQQGLPADDHEVDDLARMLVRIQQQADKWIKCHQIWVYLPDRFTTPLPVFIAVWRQSGDRNRRLRLLTEADTKSSKRKVDKVTTEHLGTGLRVRHREFQHEGRSLALRSYAFRVEEHQTDLQIHTMASNWLALAAAAADIERLVQGITVYRNTDERRVAEP